MTQIEILRLLNEIKANLSDGLEDEYSDRTYLCETTERELGVLIANIEQDNR